MHSDYHTGTATGSAPVVSYGFPTPSQATTASKTLSLQLSYPTADEIKADWVVFSGKVTKGNKAAPITSHFGQVTD